jgi:nitrogen-specific signal transduction histidine kinase
MENKPRGTRVVSLRAEYQRELNMLASLEEPHATQTPDRSPIQLDFNANRAAGTIPKPSGTESWQKRISSIGWLSTSIVHDLRNPLGAVLAGAEMLMDLDPGSAQGQRLVANIYRAASRMRELLADLAGANCGDKSIYEICNIRKVITTASEAALSAAETQSVQILYDVPEGLEILLQRSRIERV